MTEVWKRAGDKLAVLEMKSDWCGRVIHSDWQREDWFIHERGRFDEEVCQESGIRWVVSEMGETVSQIWSCMEGFRVDGSVGFLCVRLSAEKSFCITGNKQWALLDRNKAPNKRREHVIIPVFVSFPELEVRYNNSLWTPHNLGSVWTLKYSLSRCASLHS